MMRTRYLYIFLTLLPFLSSCALSDYDPIGSQNIDSRLPKKVLGILLEEYDTDGDGTLSYQEACRVSFIDCSSCDLLFISWLEYFPSLDSLDCSDNYLETLDLSLCPGLKYLKCDGNQISSLDVSQTQIHTLFCSPMNSDDGTNCLEYLFVFRGQEIESVTSLRSDARIPSETMVVSLPKQ